MAGNLTAMIASIFSGSAVTADPYYEYTTLLLPGNGTNGAQNNTFLDGSTNNFTITRNGNTTQGTFSPFSQTGWGNYFDGSGDYLATPTAQTPLTLNTDDFTLECWYYLPTQVQANTCLISSSNSSSITNALLMQLNTTTNAWELFINGTNLLASASGRSATLNTWQHIAITRSGSTFNFYLNGVAATGVSTSSASISVANWLVGYWYLAAHALTGYISNLRIVKGVVVYTGNFTPPTSPLAATQSAGTNISAITGTQTSLLTCQSNRFVDNSSNNFTITPNGNTSVVPFSPFNPTASWSAATYGGSGYFDGSGDSLVPVGANTANAMGTGDWTFETWVYKIGTGQESIFDTLAASGGTTDAIRIRIDASASGGAILFFRYGAVVTSGGTVTLNTWNHIALVRQSGTLKIYLNGTQVNTTYNDSGVNYTCGASRPIIGIDGFGGTSNAFTGYISNLRTVKGTAVYTGNFTPPTAPITNAGSTSAASYPSTTNVNTSFASSATSLLLNFTNAGIYDATSKNDLETVGNAQISTTQSKWGGSSISFDGTGDWLLIPDQPPQRIGTGNFTVEMWVYRNSSGTYGLAGKGTGTTGWLVSLNSSNQVVFTYGSSTITSSGTVSATTWTHIAVVREGTSTNQTKIYINGTNDGTGTVSTDFNQTNSMYIGADRTGGSAANAYVQDVRITNYARYTANFTPPTAAFPTL